MQIMIIDRRMPPARRSQPTAGVGELATRDGMFGEWLAEHLSAGNQP
jgi:hypothetical protein